MKLKLLPKSQQVYWFSFTPVGVGTKIIKTMKVSRSFDIREFVPKSIWDRFGENSTWFIDEKTVQVAQFYKDFFTKYYKNKHGNFKSAFDCEIILVFNDGRKVEVDYKEIHQIIQEYETTFMENGVSRIEDVRIATGWLHTDTAWIPNQRHILIVGA